MKTIVASLVALVVSVTAYSGDSESVELGLLTLDRPSFEHNGKPLRMFGDVCGLAGLRSRGELAQPVEDGETVVEVRGGKVVGVYSGRVPGKRHNYLAITSVTCVAQDD